MFEGLGSVGRGYILEDDSKLTWGRPHQRLHVGRRKSSLFQVDGAPGDTSDIGSVAHDRRMRAKLSWER